MNISSKKVLLSALTLVAVGGHARVVSAATSGVPIQAIIQGAVALTQTRSLNFGTMSVTGAGGTLNVDNTDTATPTGGVSSVGGTITAGGFTLRGTTGKQIDVSGPASVTISNGTTTMTVGSFTIDGAAGTINATPFSHSLAAITETGFRLGGTLTVGAAQAAGTYTGTVTITANYN